MAVNCQVSHWCVCEVVTLVPIWVIWFESELTDMIHFYRSFLLRSDTMSKSSNEVMSGFPGYLRSRCSVRYEPDDLKWIKTESKSSASISISDGQYESRCPLL